MNSDPLVSLDGVSKSFFASPLSLKNLLGAKPQRIRAIQNLSLEIFRGERIGIMGANGAGKTTLLRLLAGLTAPDQGELKLPPERLSILEPGAGLHPELSGEENLRLLCLLHGMKTSGYQEIRLELEALTGLGEALKRPLGGFSSGMQLRVGMAPWFFLPADLLLLDEVFLVGDEAFQMQCQKHFEKRIEDGCALVLATHSLEWIERYCQKVLVLEGGRIAQIKTLHSRS